MSNAMNKLGLTDTCRSLYPTIIEYTPFPSAHRTLTEIDHLLAPKANLKRAQRTEIIQNVFCPKGN